MQEPDSFVETSGDLRRDIDTFDEDEPAPVRAPPVREGLPPGFRMRADAHYVDTLDARMSSIPVRLIDTQVIDATSPGDAVSQAFVESVRRFGVLQPLLVSARGSGYRVIAGRRRLAAALAAGLREVPCLVQHVDAAQAEGMALASNLPATRPRPSSPQPAAGEGALAVSELAQTLAALAASADLLTSGSFLSQSVAADLVKAEAARASDLLTAMRVLRDEIPVARTRVHLDAVLELVARRTDIERRLTGIRLDIGRSAVAPDECALTGDAQLLAGGIGAGMSAAAALVESSAAASSRADIPIRLAVAASPGRRVTISVSQECVELPVAWLARPFDIAWPIKAGGAVLTRLQAARRIAHVHGGDADMTAAAGGTIFTMTLPLGAA
jgi:hypothetical protein